MNITIAKIKNRQIKTQTHEWKIKVDDEYQNVAVYEGYQEHEHFVMDAREFIKIAKTIEQFIDSDSKKR
jgi:hypothetical protein